MLRTNPLGLYFARTSFESLVYCLRRSQPSLRRPGQAAAVRGRTLGLATARGVARRCLAALDDHAGRLSTEMAAERHVLRAFHCGLRRSFLSCHHQWE